MPLIDLSTLIDDNNRSPVDRCSIEYHDHQAGAKSAREIMSVPPELLRNGEGWAIENLTYLNTHSCTHIDAPYHYNSIIQGKPAQTIDELPLEWYFSDAVKLDMTHKEDGDPMTAADAEAALEKIGYSLKPLDIVLVHTGCDKFYGQPDYMTHGCGATAEATHWLFDQGIRVMGIDAWGWDRPLHLQAQEALEKNEPGIFWEAHQTDLAYSQIERLLNLDQVPPSGFKVACFPLKIKGASGAPARVVAIT